MPYVTPYIVEQEFIHQECFRSGGLLIVRFSHCWCLKMSLWNIKAVHPAKWQLHLRQGQICLIRQCSLSWRRCLAFFRMIYFFRGRPSMTGFLWDFNALHLLECTLVKCLCDCAPASTFIWRLSIFQAWTKKGYCYSFCWWFVITQGHEVNIDCHIWKSQRSSF